MKKHTQTFRHLRLLGISLAIGLSMVLLVPEHVQAAGRGFGRGYHGGGRTVHGRVGGPRATRGGYGRGFAAGAYAGGYGTGTDSTAYAMYSARNPVTGYTGLPTGANPGHMTSPGRMMAMRQADQQYLAALAQVNAMDRGEEAAPEGQTLMTSTGTLVRKGGLTMPTDAAASPPEAAAPPPVGTTFSYVSNAQTVTIGDQTYFVSGDVYFKAYYQGSDIVYKVVEAPKDPEE